MAVEDIVGGVSQLLGEPVPEIPRLPGLAMTHTNTGWDCYGDG